MIPVFKSVINTEAILKELKPVLDSGWIGLGPKTVEFEKKVSEFLGVSHFVATNSCTGALHMAIKSLDLPSGSRILTTPISFVSTNHAILYENYEPVFCDVNPKTGNIDENLIEDAIKQYDIKAIMVVHVGGYSCEMQVINEIAGRYGVPVVEDCAHAFGSTYNNSNVGDTPNVCAWSFQAIKNLPIGDGGGISTNDSGLYSFLNKTRWLGIDKDTVSRSSDSSYSWDYDVSHLGYKYHGNDITSTIGIVGLREVRANNKRRKEIADYYLENINNNIIRPDYKKNRKSSHHFIPFFFKDRECIYNKLIAENIFCGMHYKRNDLYSMYEDFIKINDCQNAEWFQNHEMTLPIHLGLTDIDLEKIVKVVNS